MTLSQLTKLYIDNYFLPKGRSYKGKEEYRFKAITDALGTRQVEGLTLFDVEKWVNAMRTQELGPASIRRAVARMRAILNWGITRGLIPELNLRWKALDLEMEPATRAVRFPRSAEQKVADYVSGASRSMGYRGNDLNPLEDFRYRAFVLALDTGLRQNAVLNLNWDMVQPGQLLVVPRPLLKNKRATHDLEIPLTYRAMKAMQLGLGMRKTTADELSAWWSDLKRFQLIPVNVQWRDLRSEFATRLHEKGVAIETISYLLDHSSIEMTRRYLKLQARSLKTVEAIRALEGL